MTTDGDVLILNPSAPITSVYFNSDAWTGRSRCDVQGGVLFEAPIPAGFVVPGANPTFTPNHAVAILDADGKTLIQGQPYTHCTADGPVTMWWFQKAEQIDGTGISGGHGGSKLSSIGGTIRLRGLRRRQHGMVRLRTRHGVLDRRERGSGVRPQLGLLDDAGLEGRSVGEGHGPDLRRPECRR